MLFGGGVIQAKLVGSLADGEFLEGEMFGEFSEETDRGCVRAFRGETWWQIMASGKI